MGFIHEVKDNYFGLEERRESFKIQFGADREEHDVFVHADKGFSGSIELTPERIADLRRLLDHPSIVKRLHQDSLFQIEGDAKLLAEYLFNLENYVNVTAYREGWDNLPEHLKDAIFPPLKENDNAISNS